MPLMLACLRPLAAADRCGVRWVLPQMNLLDRAVKMAAEQDESEDMNFVRKHAREQAEERGVSIREAASRIFSNASGSYSSNVNLAVENSSWSDEQQLQEMYLSRKSFAFNSDRCAPPLVDCPGRLCRPCTASSTVTSPLHVNGSQYSQQGGNHRCPQNREHPVMTLHLAIRCTGAAIRGRGRSHVSASVRHRCLFGAAAGSVADVGSVGTSKGGVGAGAGRAPGARPTGRGSRAP